MQHEQVVAEVEICLAWVLGRQRPASQVVDRCIGHGADAPPGKAYAPAQVDFFHVGEEIGVEAAALEVYAAADHQCRPCGPVYVGDAVVLAAVGFAGAEYSPTAVGIAVAVEESAAGSGILEHIFLSVRQ